MPLQPLDTQKWVNRVWGEPLTVRSVRPNSADVAADVTGAAYRLGLREAAASNGVYASGDVRFTLALDAVEFQPKPRDTVTWDGAAYTVLDVSGSKWTGHWVLTGRNLILAHDLRGTGALSRPVPGRDDAGRPTKGSYTAVAADVPCRVQPEGGTATDALGKRQAPKRFTAYLGQQLDARAGDKFVSGGVTYTVLGVSAPERIDQLMSLTLEAVL